MRNVWLQENTSSCSEEITSGKAKKERTVSSSKESGEGKSKKERRSSGAEEIAEGKTKKERKSSCSDEIASSKAKKERTVEESKTKDTEGDWKAEFERRKREIIKLWDACHIPLVHRSYFCLLFKGDPSDAVYMEVEHRRLSFLKTEGTSTNDDLPSRYYYYTQLFLPSFLAFPLKTTMLSTAQRLCTGRERC